VVEDQAGRLDRYIASKCPDLSRTRVQGLIEENNILVNGQAPRPSRKLQSGDIIDITVPAARPFELAPENIELKVIYEDPDLLVVDKPAGMTVHPAPGNYTHTLANAVLARMPDIETDNVERPGIVHRLDKDTSGLIIIAKNRTAHMKLADQFKDRQVSKTYLALVNGHLTPEEGIIEAGIGRDPRHRKRMAVVSEGRPARSEYKVVKYVKNYTLLEVRPKTGRTHQIRVHLAAIGFPIVGDTTYGAKSDIVPRQFLHAARLKFRSPSSGDWLEIESGLPPDLAQALQEINGAEKQRL